jgi:hypothetical protein
MEALMLTTMRLILRWCPQTIRAAGMEENIPVL